MIQHIHPFFFFPGWTPVFLMAAWQLGIQEAKFFSLFAQHQMKGSRQTWGEHIISFQHTSPQDAGLPNDLEKCLLCLLHQLEPSTSAGENLQGCGDKHDHMKSSSDQVAARLNAWMALVSHLIMGFVLLWQLKTQGRGQWKRWPLSSQKYTKIGQFCWSS